jgi:HPt (histidine-containing phosphotransfer) domain-containing protein
MNDTSYTAILDSINDALVAYFAGDQSQYCGFLDLYISQSEVYFNEACQAVEEQNFDRLKTTIHTWKPAILMVGASRLHHLAETIDASLERASHHELTGVWKDFCSLHSKVNQALKEYLNTPNPQ